MRLTAEQISTIRRLVQNTAGASARVVLFGSRVDDAATGGDVDLLLETTEAVPLAAELSLVARLERELGLSVDVITGVAGQPGKPIVEIARLTGVEL